MKEIYLHYNIKHTHIYKCIFIKKVGNWFNVYLENYDRPILLNRFKTKKTAIKYSTNITNNNKLYNVYGKEVKNGN